jgi:hypothetical protein
MEYTLMNYLLFNLFVLVLMFYHLWIRPTDDTVLLFPEVWEGGPLYQKIGRVVVFVIFFLPAIVIWYLWLGCVCLYILWTSRK